MLGKLRQFGVFMRTGSPSAAMYPNQQRGTFGQRWHVQVELEFLPAYRGIDDIPMHSNHNLIIRNRTATIESMVKQREDDKEVASRFTNSCGEIGHGMDT